MCRFGAADRAYCAEGAHGQAIHVATAALYNFTTQLLPTYVDVICWRAQEINYQHPAESLVLADPMPPDR
jgi:hypothetical protein